MQTLQRFLEVRRYHSVLFSPLGVLQAMVDESTLVLLIVDAHRFGLQHG
jgi:hypothetical protein